MHARVVKASGWSSEEDGRRFIEQTVIPTLKGQRGFAGGYWLYDRAKNRLEGVTLWETEEDVRASDEAARQIRDTAMTQIGSKFDAVETYEVIAQVPVARTSAGTGAPTASA
jgi:hypothetical protein